MQFSILTLVQRLVLWSPFNNRHRLVNGILDVLKCIPFFDKNNIPMLQSPKTFVYYELSSVEVQLI